MLVFGAIDFAAAVARIGVFLGYRVTVCDARPLFATGAASPTRTRSWSSGRIATSRHRCGRRGQRPHGDLRAHPRPEVRRPLLEVALRTAAGYVGAMGSRRTHEERLERLRGAA